ncbi:hypothetical protein ACQPW3_37185 [Actinosynnema sp. CA-248983]
MHTAPSATSPQRTPGTRNTWTRASTSTRDAMIMEMVIAKSMLRVMYLETAPPSTEVPMCGDGGLPSQLRMAAM